MSISRGREARRIGEEQNLSRSMADFAALSRLARVDGVSLIAALSLRDAEFVRLTFSASAGQPKVETNNRESTFGSKRLQERSEMTVRHIVSRTR